MIVNLETEVKGAMKIVDKEFVTHLRSQTEEFDLDVERIKNSICKSEKPERNLTVFV